MHKLAMVLGVFVFAACASEEAPVSHLDTHLTGDGVYGTFVQGDLRLEVASFEVAPGEYSVTIVADDFAIDVLSLPPGSHPVPTSTLRDPVVGLGERDRREPSPGAFLLLPDRRPLPSSHMRDAVVGAGASSSNARAGIDLGDLADALRAQYPEPPAAVEALLLVADSI